ncbi:MAG: hypothetical protein M3Z97_01555 [Candidatus Dormibacteraeota bacterium]|nr:hypothetical protein [Candidatus Dormibacteraeota bacterium]
MSRPVFWTTRLTWSSPPTKIPLLARTLTSALSWLRFVAGLGEGLGEGGGELLAAGGPPLPAQAASRSAPTAAATRGAATLRQAAVVATPPG